MVNISIIIVTFKSADLIEKCLSCIRKNINSFKIELVIIDNNSDDDTLLNIKKFSSEIRQNLTVKIIENSENIGFASAVNQGLKEACGDFILVMNPDVFLFNGFLRQSVSLLNEDCEIGLIAPQHLSLKNKIIPSCREFPDYSILLWEITGLSILFNKSKIFGRWRMGYFDHKSVREVDQPMASCLMGKKEVIDKIGPMDERFTIFFNDVDWCRRFKEKGYKIIFHPGIKIYHLVGHSVKQRKYSMILHSHFEFYLYLKKYYKKRRHRLLNLLSGIILFVTAFIRIIIHFFKKNCRKIK